MADLVLKDLARRDQLVKLRAKADRYRRAGQPVPFRLQVEMAVVQNAIPAPEVDERRLANEDTRVARRAMGINRGRRVTSQRTPAGYIDKASLGGRPAKTPRLTTRERTRQAAQELEARSLAWIRRPKPARVSVEDWELLRLSEVEELSASEIATKLERKVTAAAVQKRLERARAAK
jgi:predicted DNA-binding protein (UPF0251 family)